MKTFLVSTSSLCFCGILLCFFAYATNLLPGAHIVTSSQQVEISQVALNPDEAGTPPTMEADPLCSPCVERIAFVLEMAQEWEDDSYSRLATEATPAGQGWVGLSPAQREKAKQFFDQYGIEERLRRLREFDPEAAWQFDRKHSVSLTRDEADDASLTQ